jgi:ribokinase
MPDFFMDRLINLGLDPKQFSAVLSEVVERKGGSIDRLPTTDQNGGNAINVASALLALGAKVTPIVCTSKLGLQQIRSHLQAYNVDFSHIKQATKASVTTALEFEVTDGKTNVMLRDVGSLAEFGPQSLDESDYHLIEAADYVCLFNWAGTLKHGTALAQAVFSRAKAGGKCKTFFDTADPLPNKEHIPQLLNNVLKGNLVDVLSVNENEAVTYASLLSSEIASQLGKLEFNELALASAQVLAKHLQARIDLHTTTFAVSIVDGKAVFVPTFKVQPLRATGAGDAWDAGNIVGDANGLSDQARLTLANAVSACYLSSPDGAHPTREVLAKFLRQL